MRKRIIIERLEMMTVERSKEFEMKWDECLKFIHDNIGDQSFNIWFKSLKFAQWEDEKRTLSVKIPTKFFIEFIESNYRSLMESALQRFFGEKTRLVWLVNTLNDATAGKESTTRQASNTSTHAQPSAYTQAQMVLPQNKAAKPINNPFFFPGVKGVDSQLNPSYTFSNFVEGDCNRLARNAGLSIAKNAIKQAYNPLLIYGKSGLGKTHLVQAIGTEIKENNPKKNVIYVDADTFERQYVQAVNVDKNPNDFLRFYQSMDVLILEDVQMFCEKKGTQNAFFTIFNYLQQKGKQIIITSDCLPVEMVGINERLLNRFKWGLSAEITVPSFETRLEILKQKIEKEGIDIDEEIVEYIANHITTNVRELEGVLISILAEATINKKQLNLDLAKDVVEKLVKNSQQDISIDSIKKTVCEYFNITPDLLKSKTRKREIVQSRQVAMYFAKIYTKNSLATIGSMIGGKDHATVLHACKTVNNLMETDKRFKRYITDLEKRFKLQ